jgi:hypothetical protein
VKGRHVLRHFAVSIWQLVVLDIHLRDRKAFRLHFYYISTYEMVANKVKEEWISGMCRDHPKLPRFVVENLAETYAEDDGKWLKENKKKEEKMARKQAKKGKGKLTEVEQDPDRFKIMGAIEVEKISKEERAAEAEKD